MREHITILHKWLGADLRIAEATVVSTWGSSPRPPGSQMYVNQQGGMTGSVSGGCVEGAVVEAALEVLREGGTRRLDFGVTDETAWEVGLACGGEIQVFVKELQPDGLEAWSAAVGRREGALSVMLLKGEPGYVGGELILDPEGGVLWEDQSLPADLISRMKVIGRESLPDLRSSMEEITALSRKTAGNHFFLRMEQPPLTLVVIGGVHIAVPLVQMAGLLGFKTVIVDPRRTFASAERFPDVDRLIQKWPQKAFQEMEINARTAVAALTHDPKIDDPALESALRSDAFYVGALGSRSTQSRRRERLASRGVSRAALDRIHGPIGLDLGGRSAGEIALAILAEIIQVRHQ